MDRQNLPQESLEAGREYYDQLKHLGLHPEGCLWLLDQKLREFNLLIVWSGIDKYGPLAMAELLFTAYRSSILPQSIDPFLVQVRSTREIIARDLISILESDEDIVEVKFGHVAEYDRVVGQPNIDRAPFYTRRDWIYHIQSKRRSTLDVSKDWRRFSARISAEAA